MTRIQVTSFYRGRPSNEQPISAGVYEIDDDALHGAGKYLLANGWAVELDEAGLPLFIPTPSEPQADPRLALRELLENTRRGIERMRPALIESAVLPDFLTELQSVLDAAAQQLFDFGSLPVDEDGEEEDAAHAEPQFNPGEPVAPPDLPVDNETAAVGDPASPLAESTPEPIAEPVDPAPAAPVARRRTKS